MTMATLTVDQLKEYLDMVPDDAEVILGIGEYEAPLVDILRSLGGHKRVRLVNQTYLDDCKIIK